MLEPQSPQHETKEALNEARASLYATEERFRLLVDSVRDYAIFMLDPSGRIVSWNTGAERIKGYAAAEIIGEHFSKFYPKEDVDSGKCEMELEMAARDGRFEDEGWRIRKDGTPFWANVVITALRDGSGSLVGFAKVTRDLTERREAEEARIKLAAEQKAREAAEAASEAKDDFWPT
jgi:PAS domain S-box-containing protein